MHCWEHYISKIELLGINNQDYRVKLVLWEIHKGTAGFVGSLFEADGDQCDELERKKSSLW